jgi:transcriptional regulator with XRE-family HTH domain
MTDDRLTMTIRLLEEMISQGWTAAAIAKGSGVNQITVGNIKNRKASRVTEKVYDKIAAFKQRIDAGLEEKPKRGRKAASTPASGSSAPASMDTTARRGPRRAAESRLPVEASKPAERRGKGELSVGAKKTQKAGGSSNVQRRETSGAESDFAGMINTRYVPVDIGKLQEMLDQLIGRFAGAIEELEAIKSQLKV